MIKIAITKGRIEKQVCKLLQEAGFDMEPIFNKDRELLLSLIHILPALIDYKDVKEIKLVSKHKVKIKHKGISTLYILDAESFYEEVMENIEEYKKSVNQED